MLYKIRSYKHKKCISKGAKLENNKMFTFDCCSMFLFPLTCLKLEVSKCYLKIHLLVKSSSSSCSASAANSSGVFFFLIRGFGSSCGGCSTISSFFFMLYCQKKASIFVRVCDVKCTKVSNKRLILRCFY